MWHKPLERRSKKLVGSPILGLLVRTSSSDRPSGCFKSARKSALCEFWTDALVATVDGYGKTIIVHCPPEMA